MRLARYRTNVGSTSLTFPQSSLASVVLMLLLHVGLAFLFRNFRIAASIHALLVLLLGLWTALTADNLVKVVPYAAYITGAELLWRMTRAGVFWEYGKYALVILLSVALIKQKKPLKNLVLPLTYFVLLLPSIILTINALGFTERSAELISFNLSGALATFVSIVFFSQVVLDQVALQTTVWAAVYPIIGILTLAVQSTLTASKIEFGGESVFVTSGGFGPNQVSAVLGLGALLLILYAIQPSKFKGRTFALILALLLIVQSFLTFSRGGIYNLVVALGMAFVILMRKPSKIFRPFFVVFVLLVIVGLFVFPKLEALTSGAFSARFTDMDPVSRVNLAKADYDLFLANPVAGVGVGMSSYFRSGPVAIAPHTEYSRVLAEHGVLGILALSILVGMLIHAFFQTPNTMAQAWMVASAGWAAVEMSHAAMRIVAISFMLGLAFATLEVDELSTAEQATTSYRFRKFRRYRK